MAIAQPQDHLSKIYRHTFRSGETLELPKFKSVITFGMARKLRHLPEEEQIFVAVESVCEADDLAVLDKMDVEEAAEFFASWQADSGATLPESSGSSA